MKETLLYLRELNHYSQSFIAKYLNISRQMYAKYENGDVAPGIKSVIALCKLYKVPYDVILENKIADKEIPSFNPSDSFEYRIQQDFGKHNFVTSPSPSYTSSQGKAKSSNYYYKTMVSYIPRLTYTESLSLLQKLAHKIEVLSQKNQLHTELANLSDKEAQDAFEFFSGKGEGLDFETEKMSYLSAKHLK